jgi:phage shock protein PspC (stress-responsive transcriptional regulator)
MAVRVSEDERRRRVQNRLTKSADDQVIDGVAGGLAAYFGVDPVVVRLAFVILAFINPATVLIYLALLVVMPEPGATSRPGALAGDAGTAEHLRRAGETVGEQMRQAGAQLGRSSAAERNRWLGIALIVGGLLFLVRQLDWFYWFDGDLVWPALLILLGGWLLLGRRTA